MKKVIFILSVFYSVLSFGQCTDCKSLKEAMIKPETVTSLRLNPFYDQVKLTSFPEGISSMKRLKILYVTDHQLTQVPVFIGELKNLKELSLAGNNLTTIPEEIFMLTNLKELILFDNEFSKDYINYIKKQCKEKLPGTKLLIDED
jgi:Leucine-rich repeat (LRR) protein